MPETASLALPLLVAEQAQKHVTHNEALTALDALVMLAIVDRDLTAPPGSPADGARYIPKATATGVWAGHEDEIAARQDGVWNFYAPQEGWLAWVRDEDLLLVYDGSDWTEVTADPGDELQEIVLFGLGTTADGTNPFSAKLNKALWTAKTAAEGGDGDLRYTMNKETTADVLSLLMQKGFSGRAEIGLIGDDNLTLKVSTDGSAWVTAFIIDTAGNIGIGSAPSEALQLTRTGSNAARIEVQGENVVNNRIRRYSSDATSPNYVMGKSRGSIASPSAVAQGDSLGTIIWQCFRGGQIRNTASIDVEMRAASPDTNAAESRFILMISPGTNAPTEIMRIEHATGFSMFGANPVIDQNRHLRLRSYTVATLPSASPAGQLIYVSDGTSNKRLAVADGTNWRWPDGAVVS